jgi:hypothetical protein
MDLLQRARTHRNAVEFSVMANNRLFVAGTADIELKTIDAMFQAQVESGDSVFRCVKPGAAMSEQ